MAINFTKGQRISIGLRHLTVGLGWDLDATACMLGEDKKLPAETTALHRQNVDIDFS